MSRRERTIVLDAGVMSRVLQRMAVEVIELANRTENLVLIGIQRRGVELAERIAKLIERDEGVIVPRGALDITLYRDDLETIGPKPVIGETRLPGDLDGKHVVIVDAVLYTRRPSRAALHELPDSAHQRPTRGAARRSLIWYSRRPPAPACRSNSPRSASPLTPSTWPRVAARCRRAKRSSTPPRTSRPCGSTWW